MSVLAIMEALKLLRRVVKPRVVTKTKFSEAPRAIRIWINQVEVEKGGIKLNY